jgi:hypothetical protein
MAELNDQKTQNGRATVSLLTLIIQTYKAIKPRQLIHTIHS